MLYTFALCFFLSLSIHTMHLQCAHLQTCTHMHTHRWIRTEIRTPQRVRSSSGFMRDIPHIWFVYSVQHFLCHLQSHLRNTVMHYIFWHFRNLFAAVYFFRFSFHFLFSLFSILSRQRAIKRKANTGTMTIIIIRSHTPFLESALEIIALPNEREENDDDDNNNNE